MESTRDAVIVDSWFYDNPGMGIDFYPDAQGTVVDHVLIDGNSTTVKQNLGFAGEQAGAEYAQSHASSNNVVTNSLITSAHDALQRGCLLSGRLAAAGRERGQLLLRLERPLRQLRPRPSG